MFGCPVNRARPLLRLRSRGVRHLVPFAFFLTLPPMFGSAVLVFLLVLVGRPITPLVPRGL